MDITVKQTKKKTVIISIRLTKYGKSVMSRVKLVRTAEMQDQITVKLVLKAITK